MTRRHRALRQMRKIGHALPLLCMLSLAAAWPAAADTWNDPTDAITKLWGGRQAAGNNWPVASCDNFAALPKAVQTFTSDTGAGLVVPKLRVGYETLTDNVRAIGRALLNTPLQHAAANAFLPTDINPNGPIVMNQQFWAANLRSSHADNLHRLPAPGGKLPDPPKNCPALAALNRDATLAALQAAPNLTNQQKWHCYAHRFRMVGKVDNGIPGFVEITHFEFLGASQYAYAESRGRFVFDYVNGRLYYTPAHYQRWSKQSFAPVDDQPPPAANSTCSPFFEIVK